MTRDVNVLRTWILIVAMIAALGTTAVPIIYSFSPWRQRLLGRLFMFQAISFAVTLDLWVILNIWRPNEVLISFWVNAVVLTAIAVSTTSLAWLIWKVNFARRRYKRKGRHRVLFTNAVYNKLKFVALILLPASASLYFGLAQIWNLPNTAQVMGSITVVDTFLGALLGISTMTYHSGQLQQPKAYDGMVTMEPHEGGTRVHVLDLNPQSLEAKDEITLRVVPPAS